LSILLLSHQQVPADDDEEGGENVPINIQIDGGKFMEEFFEQVGTIRLENRYL